MYKVFILVLISFFFLNARCETPLENATVEIVRANERARKCLGMIRESYWKNESSCPLPICSILNQEELKALELLDKKYESSGYEIRLVKVSRPQASILKERDVMWNCIGDGLDKIIPNWKTRQAD